jgi:hypothetical protein
VVFARPSPTWRLNITGLYQRCGVTYRIALNDAEQLTLTRGNGACQVLLPSHGGIFTLPDDHYFKLEFRRDASDAVDAMLFHEADGIYLVDRVPT